MLIKIYRQPHDQDEEELCVEGDIHPANLGYWMGVFFEPNVDIRISITEEEFVNPDRILN